MAEFDFNPKSPLFSPLAGYGLKAPIFGTTPSYQKGKVEKASGISLPKLPYPTVGIDFSTAQRGVDLQQPTPLVDYQTTSAVPGLSPEAQKWYEISKAMSPIRMQEMEQAARLSADLTREQLATLMPFLSAAGAESTARNLAASKSFLATKEQMPSNVQNIMASKQNQMATAAGAEAQRQLATAAQQEAAKRFAGSFAGQYIQVA